MGLGTSFKKKGKGEKKKRGKGEKGKRERRKGEKGKRRKREKEKKRKEAKEKRRIVEKKKREKRVNRETLGKAEWCLSKCLVGLEPPSLYQNGAPVYIYKKQNAYLGRYSMSKSQGLCA